MAPSPPANAENNTTSLGRIQVEISKSPNIFHRKIPFAVFMKEQQQQNHSNMCRAFYYGARPLIGYGNRKKK